MSVIESCESCGKGPMDLRNVIEDLDAWSDAIKAKDERLL